MFQRHTFKKYKQQALDIRARVSSTNIDIGSSTSSEWASLLHAKKQDQNRPIETIKQKRTTHKDIYARNNQYNPITQIYTEQSRETATKKADDEFMEYDRKKNFEHSLQNHVAQ
jgi:carbamate kinase